jgi:CubicO group peptidase (beta-lactamase class C family)
MIKFLLHIVICFSFSSIFAQQICTIDSLTKRTIDSTYLDLIKKNKVSGLSIAIVDKGKIVYATGYGFSDVESKTTANSKSIYRIGSITKSFTALSIMQLQERGILSVNDDLRSQLPEFAIGFQKAINQPILLRHMMAHISGMPGDIMNGFFTETPPSISWTIEQAKFLKMSYPAAYSHAYSNLAYTLLGEVVSRKANKPYEQYIQEAIFNPLGMQSSFISPDETHRTPKSYIGKTLIDEPLIRDAPAGLIHSNVEDMANYLLMYLNRGRFNGNQLIDSLSILEMEKKQTSELTLPENGNFGYGLYNSSYYYKRGTDSSMVQVIGHGGDTYTFHADMKYIPELGVGVVLLTNSNTGNAINSGQRLLRTYLKATQNATLRLVTPDSLSPVKNAFQPGKYCITNLLFEANNDEKLKFKQGPVKIVAKKQAQDYYTMKSILLGFIPIKIKGQAICFEEKSGTIFIKALDLENKTTEYIGYKLGPNSVSDSWRQACGTYKVVNAIPCKECPKMDVDFKNLSLQVSEKDGLIQLVLGGKGVGISNTYYAATESEKTVITVGIGRGNGETFQLLDNGNIFYSGFLFEKVK